MNAVVTGAGRGLGLEFVRQLAAQGATVIGTVRKPTEELQELGVQILTLDVGDPNSITRFGAELAKRFDRVDLLVNNAGINSSGVPKGKKNVRWGSLEPEGVLQMVRINGMGPVLVTQALEPLLHEGSKVLSISSWLGSVAGKQAGGNYGYCASKTTLNMLGRAMAFDLAPKGVTCVLGNPGWVRTDMGGEKADLSPEESVQGLLRVMARATPADAGRFLAWDGTEVPW